MTMWAPEITGRDHLTEEIASALARDIDRGRLAPGAQLPTHRKLAEHLGVAIGTVSRAYARAKADGLVTGTTGRGMFVVGKAPATDETINLSQNFVSRDLKDQSIRRMLAALGDPTELAPMMDRDQSAAGTVRHRTVAAQWISRPGFEVSPDQVVITTGIQHALYISLAVLTSPGDTMMAEQVTYAGIKAIASMLRIQVRGLAMDAEGILPSALDAAAAAGARVLYTIPTMQNPTGAVMSEGRRKEIAAIAKRHNVTVLEDDVYGFLSSKIMTPITVHAPGQCYFLASVSKSVAPGLRIGYMVCPKGAEKKMAAAVRTTTWETPPLMAEVITQWISNGTVDRVIAWKRAEIEARYAQAMQVLGRFSLQPAHPCCHLWIPVPAPWRNDEFVAQCRSRGVVVSAADAFAVGRDPAPHAIRLCLGPVESRERLQQGLQIVAEMLGDSPAAGFSLT